MPTLRSAMKSEIHIRQVGFPLLLSLLSVVLFSGHLAARSAAVPTIASDAARSIAEIRMLDATNGWAWSNGLDGQNLLLRTTDGGQTWMDRTPRAFPHAGGGGLRVEKATATPGMRKGARRAVHPGLSAVGGAEQQILAIQTIRPGPTVGGVEHSDFRD